MSTIIIVAGTDALKKNVAQIYKDGQLIRSVPATAPNPRQVIASNVIAGYEFAMQDADNAVFHVYLDTSGMGEIDLIDWRSEFSQHWNVNTMLDTFEAAGGKAVARNSWNDIRNL